MMRSRQLKLFSYKLLLQHAFALIFYGWLQEPLQNHSHFGALGLLCHQRHFKLPSKHLKKNDIDKDKDKQH